jgi:ATP-dependent Clp protease protease subunit
MMIHQPFGGGKGYTADIEIMAREIVRSRDLLVDLLVEHTGQTKDKILKDIDRDYYMSPEEAKDYGLIDTVIKKRSDRKK